MTIDENGKKKDITVPVSMITSTTRAEERRKQQKARNPMNVEINIDDNFESDQSEEFMPLNINRGKILTLLYTVYIYIIHVFSMGWYTQITSELIL